MGIECFYAVTLDKNGASVVFDPEKNPGDEVHGASTNKLVIRQILLGHEAKSDEYNVVQAKTSVLNNEQMTIPIAVLKVGETRSIRPELEFPDTPVTFTLIKGNGPVYIHGQHFMGCPDYELDEMEEEESMDEEDGDHDDEDEGNPKKKAKLSNNAKGASAGAKAQPASKNNKKK